MIPWEEHLQVQNRINDPSTTQRSDGIWTEILETTVDELLRKYLILEKKTRVKEIDEQVKK